MPRQLIYLIFLIACCGYAWWRGKKDERLGAMIMVAGSLLTVPATLLDPPWRQVVSPLLVLDLFSLAALLSLALYSERYWPIWATASHIAAVLAHLPTRLDPTIVPAAYAQMQVLWGYPMLLSLAIGTAVDRRAAMTSVGPT